MTAFAAALFLAAKADSENHARELGVSIPEHTEFILNLHHDLVKAGREHVENHPAEAEKYDFSLDPITAAGRRETL